MSDTCVPHCPGACHAEPMKVGSYVIVVSAALVLLGGCAASPSSETGEPAASTPPSTGACVADPGAVATAALPESAMQTLEGDTAVALHEAVEAALEQT